MPGHERLDGDAYTEAFICPKLTMDAEDRFNEVLFVRRRASGIGELNMGVGVPALEDAAHADLVHAFVKRVSFQIPQGLERLGRVVLRFPLILEADEGNFVTASNYAEVLNGVEVHFFSRDTGLNNPFERAWVARMARMAPQQGGGSASVGAAASAWPKEGRLIARAALAMAGDSPDERRHSAGTVLTQARGTW